MKKLFLLIIVALGVMSCEGPMGPKGDRGDGTAWDVFNIEVKSSDWDLIGTPGGIGSYYRCEVFDDQISKHIYENGTFLIYQFQILENNLEVQTALPYVLHKENHDGSIQWTETLSYDFAPGSFALYKRYSDFRTDIRTPESAFYKVVMMWW